MSFFLIGEGKVGSAFSNYFNIRKIALTHCKDCSISNETGFMFIAVSDESTYEVISTIRNKNPQLHIIHFSAATIFKDDLVFLFHPYSSISENTDISEIIFTLWGHENRCVETALENTGLKFIYAGISPSPLYHISAVISGNFTQYFFLTAFEMLKKEGFSESDSRKLIGQLIKSSIVNINESGIKGITGPASRGDLDVIEKETEELRSLNSELSTVFNNINKLISVAVKNDNILK